MNWKKELKTKEGYDTWMQDMMRRIGLVPTIGGLSVEDLENAANMAMNNFGVPDKILVSEQDVKKLQRLFGSRK